MKLDDLAYCWDSSVNVRAFARMLRHGEGTADADGYRRIFGGGGFVGLDGVPGTADDFADHPRKVVTRKLGGKPISSSAAGAYQFLTRTWDGLVRQYGFTDFSPRNQDLACVALINGRKALEDVISGRFERAVIKCNKEWASLPGSPYGQPVVTMERAKQEYVEAGGLFSEQMMDPAPPEVVKTMSVRASQPEQPMAPFIAAALPALISAVPELVKIFGSGSDTSQRNEKAVSVVMGVAKEAIGAKNEQELVTAIENDPAAAETVRTAIRENWFRIEEVGGGIKEAREHNLKVQGDRPFYYNPAFIISIVLVVMPFMLLVDVFFVHPDNYQGEIRTQIVTGVLMIVSMVGGYWLSTSFSSARKDDHILPRL